MLRRFLAALALVLAFTATQASAQSLTTYTFATLPGSPTAGQLAWITDNSGTPTVGSPAAGGAAAGNRDLVAWDATQTRWEFVARQPTAGPAVPISTLMDAVRIAYANGTSGATSSDVQSVIDELFATRTANQASPSTFSDSNATRAAITNPAATSFGFGVSFDNAVGFSDALKYPGGPSGNEPDNMLGLFYNKSGVLGSTILNQNEYSFDCSHELSYRSASTGHKTWSEYNCDYVPPVRQSTLSGSTGAFAVGDWISFSGGGSGRVVAVSGSNPNLVLTYVQNFSTSAESETVTNITQTGGGTLGALSFVGYNYDIRAVQFVYDTVDLTAYWSWDTVPNAAIPTLRLQTGSALVNSLNAPNAFFQAESRSPNKAALRAEYVSPGSSGNGVVLGAAFRMDLGSAAATPNSHSDATLIRVEAATAPSGPALAALAVNRAAAFEIFDQKGVAATDSAAIRIASQTVTGTGAAGAQGNFVMQGGNWNNGHIVLGGLGYVGSGAEHLFADQTNNRLRYKLTDNPTSETDGFAIPYIVASGTRALATGSIGAGACSTTDASITATGAVSTDTVTFSPNGDPGLNAGLLTYQAWAGSGVISFRVCNPTAGSLTPGAVSVNWKVIR